LYLKRLPAAAGTFEKFVKPVDGIESRLITIHHIKPKMVENVEPFLVVAAQLCAKIKDWGGGNRVFMLAHNGRDFDNGIMHRNYERARLDWTEALASAGVVGLIDTFRLVHAHTLFPNKIEAEGRIYMHLFPCESFPVEVHGERGEHSALSDCLALARCLFHATLCGLLCTKPVGVPPATWLLHHVNLAKSHDWSVKMKAEVAKEAKEAVELDIALAQLEADEAATDSLL
jgi:DNA polymerase III epsilon subunit-like protein